MFRKINWRYAFGEIIIVIIGITIAFSLNKWSEAVKTKKDKQKYLNSLLADIDNEKTHLEANIEAFQQKLAAINQILPYLYGRPDGRDSITQKIFSLPTLIEFYPNDVTYSTLINSGDLRLFEDFQFRKALEQHYSEQSKIEIDYSRQTSINENYFGHFMIYNLDYQKIRQGDYSFMDDKLLRNIIQSLMGTYMLAIQSSEAGIQRCDSFKEILQREL